MRHRRDVVPEKIFSEVSVEITPHGVNVVAVVLRVVVLDGKRRALNLVVIALAWSELRLTNGQRTLAYATGLIAAYGGLVGNVFGAITDLPGPASNPGVAPPMPQAVVFFTILAIIVPSLFVSFGLVLYGMRGAAMER